VREATQLEEGDPVKIEVKDGAIILRPCKIVDASQAWFWTAEWQDNVRRSLEELSSGETSGPLDEDGFRTVLDKS